MASGFRWFPLWTLVVLGPAAADPASPPRYVLSRTELNFEGAMQACAPGTLTTLATQQELDQVLRQVAASPQNQFIFWVGLKKAKNECVVRTLPLRGFKWTTDGSEDTEVSQWWAEPEQTCTNNRCAALTGSFDGSTVTKWGLIPLSCRNKQHYICKLGDGQEPRPAAPEPATPEPKPGLPTPKLESVPGPGPELLVSPTPEAWPEPATPKPEPGLPTPELESVPGPGPVLPVSPTPEVRPEPAGPKPDPGRPSSKPEPEPEPTTPTPQPGLPPPKPGTEHQPAAPEPNLKPTPGPAAPKPGLEPGPGRPGPGPDPSSGPKKGSHTCSKPHVTEIRSFSSDQNNSSSTLMECWSKVQLRLFCGGRPAIWRLVDHSPVNFTTICLPCDPGFTKNASGHCVDVDECAAPGGGSSPCKRECVNTEGSYRCVCADQDGHHHEEGSAECAEGAGEGGAMSGILIPVLVAVATLVVLVVLVAVMVKCCLMRREKKRELREEEERMAMKSKGGS